MSDVRSELMKCIGGGYGRRLYAADLERIADAILERLDVMPKPVVTDEALGRLALKATQWGSLDFSCLAACERSYEQIGRQVCEELDAAGLKIVRVDDERG